MSKQLGPRVLRLPILPLVMVSLGWSPSELSSLVYSIIKQTPSEEHLEDVVGVEVVCVEVTIVALLEILFSAMFVINVSLIGITKACEGLTYFFKGVGCLGRLIFIRMKLKSLLSVRLLKDFAIRIFSNT